jgi:hypothetical protein
LLFWETEKGFSMALGIGCKIWMKQTKRQLFGVPMHFACEELQKWVSLMLVYTDLLAASSYLSP